MSGFDKIIDDSYIYLKSKWWGLPILFIFMLGVFVFSVWNSLPNDFKEYLLSQFQLSDPTKVDKPTSEAISNYFIKITSVSCNLTPSGGTKYEYSGQARIPVNSMISVTPASYFPDSLSIDCKNWDIKKYGRCIRNAGQPPASSWTGSYSTDETPNRQSDINHVHTVSAVVFTGEYPSEKTISTSQTNVKCP